MVGNDVHELVCYCVVGGLRPANPSFCNGTIKKLLLTVMRFRVTDIFCLIFYLQKVNKAILDQMIAEGKKEQLKSFEQVNLSLGKHTPFLQAQLFSCEGVKRAMQHFLKCCHLM